MVRRYNFEGRSWTRDELVSLFDTMQGLSRIRIVNSFIKGKGNKILDIGCGIGYTSYFFADRTKEFVGTDIIAENIALAKEFYSAPNRKFFVEDIFTTAKIPKNSFDYVLLLETIEHVNNPYDFIQRAATFVKKGGHVIISTPHALSVTNYLWNLKHRNRVVKEYSFDGTETDHLYTWDRQTLQNLVTKAGLRVVEVKLSRQSLRGGQQICIKARKP